MTNDNKKLVTLVLGDSWGCGEWAHYQRDTKTVSETIHPGLAGSLLEKGENVINLSIPGGSLTQIIDNLENFLLSNCFNMIISKVYCIQTSVFRDFYNTNFTNLNHHSFKSFSGVVHQLYYNFYSDLGRLSHLNGNFPVYAIGGTQDCPDAEWFKSFHNIHLACQSWVNLCINGSASVDEIAAFDVVGAEFIEYLIKEKNLDKQDVISHLNLYNNREKLIRRSCKYFYPDGTHPNRYSHQLLYNYLRSAECI